MANRNGPEAVTSVTQTTIRGLDVGKLEQLKGLAKANRRSLNGEFLWMIDRHLAEEAKKQAAREALEQAA
jgi:hypothetical protein